MTITKRGSELAKQLNPYIGTKVAILETCSKIARLATTHARLAEVFCSVEMTAKQAERHNKRDEQIEAAIRRHVESLPHTDNGPIVVRFDGDPRGFTVKLYVPGVDRGGSSFAGDGSIGV